MRPTSDKFLAALRGSHAVSTTVDLLFPGETVPVAVPVEGGELTLDRTATIRRSGAIRIPWALEAGVDLGVDLRTLPFGGYATVKRGVRYADGATELVQLGVFRVESVAWRTTEASAGIELADRMAQVRDEPFTVPFAPPGGAGISRAGNLTDNSPVITGLSTTADLLVGQPITGIGIPADRRIQSIDSATQITMNGPANTYGNKDSHIEPGFTTMAGLSDTSDLSVGMRVQKTGVPGSDLVNPTYVTLIVSNDEIQFSPAAIGTHTGSFEFLASSPATLTFGQGRRIADGAIEIVQGVFGSTISYRKLFDPAIILDDVFFAEERAAALMELAKAAAAELFFDADGAFVFDRPTGGGPVVWEVDAGATGVLIDAGEALDRTGVYNGVLVTGQPSGSQAPVSALVVDDDPASPTRWGGPLGKVARIEQSSSVGTAAQATDAATALLNRRIGLQRSLTLVAAPNPALEPGDVILAKFPDGRQEEHVLDAIRLDLGPTGPQELRTQTTFVYPASRVRRRRVRPFAPSRRLVRTFHGPDIRHELRDAHLNV